MLGNEIPEGFKMTELGPLPEEWAVVRLGEVVRTVKGKKPKLLMEKWKEYSIPYLTAEYFRKGKISKYIPTSKNSSFIVVNNDDIVFIWDGSNAGDVFEGLNGVLASTMIKIDPNKDNINKKYLFYFLKTKFGLFNSQTTGSTIPHVNKTLFYNLEIPLPPLPEQKRIAAVLSTVQEAKEKTEHVITATKELKKSMMKHLFTYGPVPLNEADSVPLKETEIGMVPEEWAVVRLGEVYNKKSIKFQNGFPCGNWNESGIGIPHIRPFNISDEGKIIFSNLKYIQIDKNIERYILQKGDVIFNNTNSEELVGKTAYWNNEGRFVLSNHMTIIRIVNHNIINPVFLATYLHKKWFEGLYLSLCRRHVNQASISLARLKSIKIPLPPLPVQQKIASILSAVDEKIQAEENKKKALEEPFKSLLGNLMTGKIRVHPVR